MSAQIDNLFLSGLSPESRGALLSRSIEVDLPLHTVLYESGSVPRHAYFLTSGLASVVTPMSNGEVAEVGFVGHEGIVSSLQLLGPAFISTRCMMQLAGGGLKIPFLVLQRTFEASEEVRKRILEFVQEQAVMVGQVAGCNRLHSAEQRLVRWLLMAEDRTQSDVLKFTQEYLAEMIGTQRTTVTVLAGELQQRGLISYSRGTIHILNRGGLEAITCDCYQIIKHLYANLYNRDAQIVSANGNHSSPGISAS
jgi:CRP-like cAMP-binding protein